VNRREFLFPFQGRQDVGLRPPGALPEAEFQRACIRCFRCAEVCPTKTIHFDASLDPRLTDTPFLHVRDAPCILCMRCGPACPTGALAPIAADLKAIAKKVRMGRPVLHRDRCLPWSGEGTCRLCYYVCPLADSAVELVGRQRGPLFHPEACVGCGMCEEACPSLARAIRIEPLDGDAR
jgi:ferredoxin-type protein NapG